MSISKYKMTLPTPLCVAAVTALAFALSACNTTRGVGADIEAAGDTIEEVADEAEDELE